MENRFVYLRRKEKATHIPPEIMINTTRGFGPTYVRNGGGAIHKGLSAEEEKKLLSAHLGIDANADPKEFKEEVKKFWADFRVPVDFNGIKLDISVDESGMPRNIKHYITYKLAMVSGEVAKSELASKSNEIYNFFIYDPDEELLNDKLRVDALKLANMKFVKISESPERIEWVLRMLGETPDLLSANAQETKLYDLMSKDPKRFLAVADDENLSLKAEIEEFVYYGIITKIGQTFVDIDEPIGNSIEDMVVFFKNTKNSKKYTQFKALLKEKRKVINKVASE